VVLPLGFWMGTGYGPEGVAVAWAVLYPLLAGAVLLPAALRTLGLTLASYLSVLMRPFLATAAMAVAAYAAGSLLPRGSAAAVAVAMAVGIAVYGAAVRWLEGPLAAELRSLYRDARAGIGA
jgi:hypothetical protein